MCIRDSVSTSPESLSIVGSWARVLAYPKQEYMTLIGHDDLLDRDFLATTKALIERFPDAALYQTGSRLINADGGRIRACRTTPERETPAGYLAARFAFERDIFGTGYVMRSVDYDRLGGIPAFERLFFADDALWLSLMRGSYKAYDPRESFAVRIHPKSESASLPSAWKPILIGLNQFTAFLQEYVAGDPQAAAIHASQGAEFLLTYHRNVFIYALLEACQARRTIDAAVVEQIERSLQNRRGKSIVANKQCAAGPCNSSQRLDVADLHARIRRCLDPEQVDFLATQFLNGYSIGHIDRADADSTLWQEFLAKHAQSGIAVVWNADMGASIQ